jgi:CRISPR-associated protein Cas2
VRRLYIVAYDISDPKRLRRVFRTLKGYGEHLQLSVFRCDLTQSQRLRLAAKLGQTIEHAEDQVMFVDLGPSVGRSHSIDYLGRPGPISEARGPKVF